MRWKLTDQTGTPTYVVVLDPGDEAFAVLSGFAREHQLTAAQVTAVGAFPGGGRFLRSASAVCLPPRASSGSRIPSFRQDGPEGRDR